MNALRTDKRTFYFIKFVDIFNWKGLLAEASQRL